MIRPEVAKKIKLISLFLFNEYSKENQINLDSILEDEGIAVYYDDYGNAFDGMFVIDNGIHHIHLNTIRGNYPNSGRGRFSLAHEIGHYMIDEHHTDIRLGKLKPHPSFQKSSQLNTYESEADHFAANLLMPEENFFNACGGREFNWELIESLSQTFRTSKLATLLRFIHIIRHEVCIVVSKNSIIKWFMCSNDFPRMKHKFKRGNVLPNNALANIQVLKTSDIAEADPGDWFETWGGKSERVMYEQCYYAEAYEQIITLLWFK